MNAYWIMWATSAPSWRNTKWTRTHAFDLGAGADAAAAAGTFTVCGRYAPDEATYLKSQGNKRCKRCAGLVAKEQDRIADKVGRPSMSVLDSSPRGTL